MNEEKLKKKAEKKGIKVDSTVILDGDTTHVYRVTKMFIYNGIDEPKELRASLNGKGGGINWNANSPRLTVYEESDTND